MGFQAVFTFGSLQNWGRGIPREKSETILQF